MTMSDESIELPEGWEWANLGHIGEIVTGSTPSKKDPSFFGGNIPFYKPTDLDAGYEVIEAREYLSVKGASHSRILPAGAVLVTCIGATIGKTGFARKSCATNQQINAVVPSSEYAISEYIFWILISPEGQQMIIDNASATTLPIINKSRFSNLIIPIPPIAEQKRIVAKIEELRSRTQKAREALEVIPQMCDRFRQSVLAAAFRGDLTADWREQNPDVEPAEALLKRTAEQLKQDFTQISQEIESEELIPASWERTKLKAVIKHIQPGKNFLCPEIPVTQDTVGLVKISAVTWGKFNPQETKTVVDPSKVDPNLFIQAGDFLISRANTLELVGASVIVHEIYYRIMLSDKVWRVNFLEVDKRYVNFYLKSKQGRKEIESRATGNQLSMRNISHGAFKDIVICFPPLDEQVEIVDRIKKLFEISYCIQQQYEQAKARLEKLDRAILAKAFRGELVPQDPNDEPASVLLDRIREERAKNSDRSSTKRKR